MIFCKFLIFIFEHVAGAYVLLLLLHMEFQRPKQRKQGQVRVSINNIYKETIIFNNYLLRDDSLYSYWVTHFSSRIPPLLGELGQHTIRYQTYPIPETRPIPSGHLIYMASRLRKILYLHSPT